MYQSTIGLEIHVELKTRTKMFCSCTIDPEETRPNFNICPICTGHPGTLPVINKEAILMVIKTGLALNCKTKDRAYFERKNYFYPDLPKGYQISQYKAPICEDGYLEIETDKKTRKIRVQRIHLEEDTAKLIHPNKTDYSLVDFNRSGIPLMELVTKPDIHSSQEASKFAQELQLILRYIEVSDADMEKGQMRVEVNISLVPINNKKEKKLGTKVEIKNLNSFLSVERAINYEIKRQKEVLEGGNVVTQETRGWDDVKGETKPQRAKEKAQDYRYLLEPDLPPLHLKNYKLKVEKDMPELPGQKRERFQKEYKISSRESETLIRDKELSDYFENIISELKNWHSTEGLPSPHLPSLIKLAVNYIETDLLGLLKEKQKTVKDLRVSPENFAELIILIWKKEISSKAGKTVLDEMFKTGADPTYIIQEKNLKQVGDEKTIKEIAEKTIKETPKAVEDYRKGKKNAIQFLIGKVMKETKGKMDPKITQEVIREILTKHSQET